MIALQHRGRLPLRNERGTALVEFALVLPLVLVLLLGMIDVGKAVNYWNDETHLANEAARAAAVNKSPDPTSKINTAIIGQADSNELKTGGSSSIPSPMSVCIYFPNGTHNVGDPVKVVVKVQYNWLGYLVGRRGGSLPSSQLTATSTMRIEQAPTDPTNPNTSDAYFASSSC